MKYVWVVTSYCNCEEPIVTVFDNKLAADKYMNWVMKNKDCNVCEDKVWIYSSFEETESI